MSKIANLLRRFIIGNKTGVYSYDVQTKAQSSELKQSNVNVLLNIFFDNNDVWPREFLSESRVVNKKCAGCVKQKNVRIYDKTFHDVYNKIMHLFVTIFLAKNKTKVMLGLGPYNFSCFR